MLADEHGQMRVDRRSELAVFDGHHVRRPEAAEIVPLPRGSDVFFLPQRRPLGFRRGAAEASAVQPRGHARFVASAFLAPAWLRLLHPACQSDEGAPRLPLFAYAPLGWQRDRYVTCAVRIDPEPRQDPWRFPMARIERRVRQAMDRHRDNRLVRHLSHCALSYHCRAAQNFFLRRWEAPLPTARSCNASCLGCISSQDEIEASHERIAFTPSAEEVAEVALVHSRRVPDAVVSFGQGCEGEPLMNPELLLEAVERIRARDRDVTINLNSNASRPEVVRALFRAGLSSLRVSLNSAREAPYLAYFQPRNYRFDDVLASMAAARSEGGFVSLNYFTFPGFTDRLEEVEALERLVRAHDIDMIQWRNLNVDPEHYLEQMPGEGEPLSLTHLLARLRGAFPKLRHGYFNPPVPPRA